MTILFSVVTSILIPFLLYYLRDISVITRLNARPYFNLEYENGKLVVLAYIKDKSILTKIDIFYKRDDTWQKEVIGHWNCEQLIHVCENVPQVDSYIIKAETTFGENVYFIYGNGINGTHFYKQEVFYSWKNIFLSRSPYKEYGKLSEKAKKVVNEVNF